MQKWDVRVNDVAHTIEYGGSKVSGQAKIWIDDIMKEYKPVVVPRVGIFYPMEIDGSEIILKTDMRCRAEGLIQDGVYLDSGLPMEASVLEGYRNALHNQDPLVSRSKMVTGSFLMLVILTFVNLILIYFNAPVSFPFSAFVPGVLLSLGLLPFGNIFNIPSAVLIAAAILFAGGYLALFLLSRKYRWPILAALILFAIDTAVLLYFTSDDLSGSVIAILFHAWVLWTFLRLYLTRRKISRAAPAAAY